MTVADLLLPLLFVAVFYFLILRPARVRQREAQALQAALAPGQEVMTASGMHATVRFLDDDSVLLEIAPGVQTRWARAAIARIVTGDAADQPEVGDPASSTATGRHSESAPDSSALPTA